MSRETMKGLRLSILLVLGVGIVLGIMIAQNGPKQAEAAGGKVKNPAGIAPDRYSYFPGTEELGTSEMRLIALGTGLPAARRSQAATCWLLELGNGDKFLFDIGTGANANMAALNIPFDFLTKVFLTHLHTDHWGDLPGLWAGGWTSGRTVPLELWGPSGATEEMGTKYAIEHFLKAYHWDRMTRLANLPSTPGTIIASRTIRRQRRLMSYRRSSLVVRSRASRTPSPRRATYRCPTGRHSGVRNRLARWSPAIGIGATAGRSRRAAGSDRTRRGTST